MMFKADRAMRITHLQVGVEGSSSYRSIRLREPFDLAIGDALRIEPIDEEDAEAQILQGTTALKDLRRLQK